MNWFQRLWANPNTHIAIGTIAGVASAFVPPAYAPVAAGVAAVFGGAGIALPDAPKTVTVPAPTAPIITTGATGTTVTLPPAAGGGSYHTEDYINLAVKAAVEVLQKQQSAGRS